MLFWIVIIFAGCIIYWILFAQPDQIENPLDNLTITDSNTSDYVYKPYREHPDQGAGFVLLYDDFVNNPESISEDIKNG